jgi:hypothetical protein
VKWRLMTELLGLSLYLSPGNVPTRTKQDFSG